MELEELRVYQMAMQIGEEIWEIVMKWDFFTKDTVGKQLVRAIDSVASNLSEGFGRFHFKENINFCYYSRGSLYETKTWLTKAYQRDLIPEDIYKKHETFIKDLSIKLNNYINTIGKKSQ